MQPVMAPSHDPVTQADFQRFAESLRADFRQMRSDFEQANKELRSDLEEANKELRSDFEQANKELRADFEQANRELRADLEQANKELRTDLEQANKELRTDFEQAHKELRTDFGRVDRTVAGLGGESRMLKWSVGVGMAAILGGLGVLYQALADLRSDMVRGNEALRVEIVDLGERTTRLEEGQRYIQGRLQELIDHTHPRLTTTETDNTSASPS